MSEKKNKSVKRYSTGTRPQPAKTADAQTIADMLTGPPSDSLANYVKQGEPAEIKTTDDKFTECLKNRDGTPDED